MAGLPASVVSPFVSSFVPPSVNPPPAPVLDIVIGRTDDAQPPLPLASDGVLRWLWHSRFGEILIEVIDDDVFVNGKQVNRHAS